MFVLGKGCICFYLQVLVNLGALCFSRTDGFIAISPALLSVTNLTAHRVRWCLLIKQWGELLSGECILLPETVPGMVSQERVN